MRMTKRIVVLGAGVAGAQFLKLLHKKFHHQSGYSIMVIDRWNYSAFVPMLHEAATGSVDPRHIAYPIRQILHCCLERFLQADVQSIDLEKRLVRTSQGLLSRSSASA